MALPTLLDIAKINGATEGLVALFDEAARVAPEVTGMTYRMGRPIQVDGVGGSRTIRGTQYKTLIRTALPTAQYRAANAGVTPTKSSYENRLVECMIMDLQFQADKAVADANEDGAAMYLAEEAQAELTAAFMQQAKVFYYGRNATFGDVQGHPGLIDAVDASLVVDAGGTTDNVASSLWAVTFGQQYVQWVYGNNAPFQLADPRIQTIADPNDSTKFLTAYVQNLTYWAGLQVKHKFAVGRIKKLTTDSGKGLTDALIGSLVSKFPAAYTPAVFFASRRSIEQLRASRTATTTTGKEADVPVDWQGIPIIPTDAISNIETLAL